MGIFRKLTFWKKNKLPDFPEDNMPLETQKPFQDINERPNFAYKPQRFEEQSQPNTLSYELQVISSKLDVLNAKIEVLNERISNLERNLNDAKVKW